MARRVPNAALPGRRFGPNSGTIVPQSMAHLPCPDGPEPDYRGALGPRERRALRPHRRRIVSPREER